MAFNSVSYISKILWRFYGGSDPTNPELGINDIQNIFSKDRIVLEPYHGTDGTQTTYIRQIQFEENSKSASFTTKAPDAIEDEQVLYAQENKAVCYCDIPINHLAVHMRKYNVVGIGVNRDLLAEKAADLQPVRYFFIRSQNEFRQSIPGVFTLNPPGETQTISVENYIKIPTLFSEYSVSSQIKSSSSGVAKDVSEGFNSIYEEREWRHHTRVELGYDEISFLLLPSRNSLSSLKQLNHLFKAQVGIIYADQLFPEGEK